MVGRRGSQAHQWVVAGVAALVVSGNEGIRAQPHESARRTESTAPVSAHMGEPRSAEEDRTAARLGPPANLVVPASHQKIVRTMWEQSPTFRSQCERIGGGRTLTVHVRPFPQMRSTDAATHFVHRPGSGLIADVYLFRLDRFVELLAHELEHIIEQVEGIDLGQLARRAPHLAWSTANRMYETRRAIHSGQTVASEVAMAQK